MILRDRNKFFDAELDGVAQDGSYDVDALRAAVQEMMRKSRIPGLSIAVTRGNERAYVDAFGHADLADFEDAAPTTRYLWFSMTKLATATAALRLADEGRLDLDAPVSEQLPWLPLGPEGAPTVRQLLTHTAGLTNPLPIRWVHPAADPAPNQSELVRRLVTRRTFARPPGHEARYSNLGYLLVAEVIHQMTGQPFAEYVVSAVLQPLAMTSTSFDAAAGKAAVGYLNLPRPLPLVAAAALPSSLRGPTHGRVQSLRPFLVDGAGYGGLVGPVTDAARFLRMHLNDGQLDGTRILTAGTTRRMRGIVSRGRPFDHATGWFRKPTGVDTYLEHYGTGAGFWNVMRIYPEQNLGIVMMTNSTVSYPFHQLMTAIAAAVSR
jgi:CubicO group peptidase (beta-lactamase class C family)